LNLKKTGAKINYKTGKFTQGTANGEPVESVNTRVERAALTVFHERMIGPDLQNQRLDGLDLAKKCSEGLHAESCTQEQSVWLV
jgi:hypothetical protein